MKLGILICDQVQEQLQPEFGDYPAMFRDIIEKTDLQVDITFFSAIDRQLPKDIDVCDAYMTSGSRWCVNDDSVWIRELEDFIRALYKGNKGFAGICFGHQLIAKSLGGRVGKSNKGWGIGVAFSEIVSSKKWMTSLQTNVDLVVSHQDQIVELPAQAEVLLSNDFCPYSMFQLGNHFLGVQGHPEFSRAYSLALMNSRKDRIPALVIETGAKSLSHEVDEVLAMRWILNFLQQSTSKILCS
jgi:GMP synthase-like glutamine amidotransferase